MCYRTYCIQTVYTCLYGDVKYRYGIYRNFIHICDRYVIKSIVYKLYSRVCTVMQNTGIVQYSWYVSVIDICCTCRIQVCKARGVLPASYIYWLAVTNYCLATLFRWQLQRVRTLYCVLGPKRAERSRQISVANPGPSQTCDRCFSRPAKAELCG